MNEPIYIRNVAESQWWPVCRHCGTPMQRSGGKGCDCKNVYYIPLKEWKGKRAR